MLGDVIENLLSAAVADGNQLYCETTWHTLRAAVTPPVEGHRQLPLPHDLSQIKRLVDDIDNAIRVFDALCHGQLDTATEIEQALDNGNLVVGEVLLPNRQGRFDHIEFYLTHEEFADFQASRMVVGYLVGLLGKCQSSTQELRGRAVTVALIHQMIAGVIRFGSIGVLGDLHRRVALVFEVLSRQVADLGQPRKRGRPLNRAVEARDRRLLELHEQLVDRDEKDTAGPLLKSAKADATILELLRFGSPLNSEICRSVIRASAPAEWREQRERRK